MISSFSEFCSHIIQEPEVIAAMGHLETAHPWYPSVMLFIAWHIKQHYGRFSQAELKSLHQSVQTWHERVVYTLRMLYKTSQSHLDQDCLDQLKKLCELGFSYEVTLLENKRLGHKIRIKQDGHLASDVCHNILLYAKLLQSKLNADDAKAIKIFIQHVFSSNNPTTVAETFDQQFLHFNSELKTSEQLLFDRL